MIAGISKWLTRRSFWWAMRLQTRVRVHRGFRVAFRRRWALLPIWEWKVYAPDWTVIARGQEWDRVLAEGAGICAVWACLGETRQALQDGVRPSEPWPRR